MTRVSCGQEGPDVPDSPFSTALFSEAGHSPLKPYYHRTGRRGARGLSRLL